MNLIYTMRKILIISFIVIAVLTAVFFKDIARHIPLFINYDPPADTSTVDEVISGASLLIQVKPMDDVDGSPINLSKEDMAQMQQSIADRLLKYGDIDYTTTILGADQIEVQIAEIGQEEALKIWESISYSTRLTIHEAHPFHNQARSEAHALAEKVANGEEIVPTYTAYPTMMKDENGVYMRDENGKFTVERYYLVKRRAAVRGVDIEFAQASAVQPGTTEVTLTKKGGQDMLDFTRNMKQGELIITVLDRTVVSAASLNAPSLGRRFVITGGANRAESEKLAKALNNPLQHEIELIQIQTIK